MDTLARKIIDAIQNSLVGDLVMKLIWPFGYLCVAFTEDVAFPTGGSPLLGPYAVLLLASIFLIWLLGTIAKTAPRRPMISHLSDRVTRPPENGFETWSQPPANGLHPPEFMRRIVETIGGTRHPKDQKFGWLSVAFVIAAILLAASIGEFPGFWSKAHPLFTSAPMRLVIIQACLLVLLVFQVRQWATEQKLSLARQDELSNTTSIATA